MGKIFYLMGKSSSGKDTIYKELIQISKNEKDCIVYNASEKRRRT